RQSIDIRVLLDKKARSQQEVGEALRQQLQELLRNLESLLRPDSDSLAAAWELVASLESMFPRMGDKEYIGTLLALELGLENRKNDSPEPWGHYGWGRVLWSHYFDIEELHQLYQACSGNGPTPVSQITVGEEISGSSARRERQPEWDSVADRAVE